jgi:3-hydroxyisobutyrate dehydrogenase-like beta-hydroxyacid dehydrogenase
MIIESKMEKIGIVGFGVMGKVIANNLHKSGFGVLVYDINDDAIILAQKLGYTTYSSPKEIALNAKIIVLSLPNPKIVSDVVYSDKFSLLSAASKGSIIIDTSTVDAETTITNAKEAYAFGISYLDSPILGRPSAVGNWTLPIGGDIESIESVRHVLETFASNIISVGALGTGNTIKLLNNLMFGAINSITCEVFSLCKRQSVDPKLFFDTISKSGAATVSKLFNELAPKIIDNDFSPVFSINNLHKDVGLGMDMAMKSGIRLNISESGQQLNDLARREGFGDEDTSAIIKVLDKTK